MDRFFVYKPVFGWVIAAFIALAGIIALATLPVEQYPSVAPPALRLSYTYTGADADTLDRNVTSVIEREMSGIDGFLSMNSTSRANGTGQIALTFKAGTDLDVARSNVRDRLNRAEPRLPQAVQQMIVANSIAGALSEFQAEAGAVSALVGAFQYGSGVVGSGLVGIFADGTPRPMGYVIAAAGLGSLICAGLVGGVARGKGQA